MLYVTLVAICTILLLVVNIVTQSIGKTISFRRPVEKLSTLHALYYATILAFAPIGLSQDSTGEYFKSLFQVLLISLMLSWFSALTITPVLIKWWLFKGQQPPAETSDTDPYSGRFYRIYQQILHTLLMRKAITLTVMAALLAASIWGFGSVRQNFFPSSNTPIFFVDLFLNISFFLLCPHIL